MYGWHVAWSLVGQLLPSWYISGNALLYIIERFDSRGKQLRKFIGANGSGYIRKKFNSQRIGLEHQHGLHFIFLETNMAAVTSREHTLYPIL